MSEFTLLLKAAVVVGVAGLAAVVAALVVIAVRWARRFDASVSLDYEE